MSTLLNDRINEVLESDLSIAETTARAEKAIATASKIKFDHLTPINTEKDKATILSVVSAMDAVSESKLSLDLGAYQAGKALTNPIMAEIVAFIGMSGKARLQAEARIASKLKTIGQQSVAFNIYEITRKKEGGFGDIVPSKQHAIKAMQRNWVDFWNRAGRAYLGKDATDRVVFSATKDKTNNGNQYFSFTVPVTTRNEYGIENLKEQALQIGKTAATWTDGHGNYNISKEQIAKFENHVVAGFNSKRKDQLDAKLKAGKTG